MGVLRSSAFIGRCEIDTHAILVKSPVLPWSTSPASIVSTNVRIFQGSVHGIRADFHFGPTPGAGTLGLLAPIPTSVIPANGDLCVTPVVGHSVAEMASIPGGEPPTLDSRLHGNDEPAAAHPTIVIPKTAGIHGSHIVIPKTRRRGAGDGFPSPRERRAHHNRHSQNSGNPRQPHRHSRDGGNPRRGAGDGFPHDGPPHNRHSREGGNPRRGPAMGSPLHGNDDHRRRRTPQSSFPKRRESTAATSSFPRRRGAGDGFPSPRERRATSRRRTPQSSFPRRRESTAAGDGFPRRERRRRRRTPQSSFPRRRESTAATSSFPRRRESIPDMVRHHDS